MLIDKNNINLKKSLLFSSLKTKNLEITKLLLKKGANLNIYVNSSPLLHKSESLNIEFLKLFLNHKPNLLVNIRHKQNGKTILHKLVETNQREKLKTLLKEDTLNLNMRDNEGNTALHYAVLYENQCNS